MTSTSQPTPKLPSNVNFRELFRDIAFGWSQFPHKGRQAYLKHLSVFDQVNIEELKDEFYRKARSRGLPTKKEAMERLAEEEMWTSVDEGKIKQQEIYIETALNTKKELYLKKEIEKANEDLLNAQKILDELLSTKDALLGQTCEKYSDQRVSDHYVVRSLYKDSDLSKPFYEIEEIDNMSRQEMALTVKLYNGIYGRFSDINVQKIILRDFYQPYIPFCENVHNIFTKPLFELSINQVKLIIYSRMFKNIFENYTKIPEAIKEDPEKIIDYVNAQEKAKDKLENMDKDGASTIIGAKNEDYEYLGLKSSSENSLSAKLREKGGKMDMKDLMQALKA